MSFDLFVIQIFNGLVVGLIYVLMAMGLSIVWGMMDIINFSHGLFYTLGAYLAYSIVSVIDNFFISLFLVPIAVGAVAVLIEMTLLRRLRGFSILYQVLMTFGIALMGKELIIICYGNIGKSFNTPKALSGIFPLGDVFFPKYRVFVFLIGIVIIIGMWLFIEKTKYGSIIRAGTENAEMVSALGININRVFSLIFGVSIAVAAFSGALSAPIRGVDFMMGDSILGICFAVVILGGLGSYWGCVVGGLIIGLSQSLVSFFIPQASIIIVYLMMAAILLVRPRGLFGQRD